MTDRISNKAYSKSREVFIKLLNTLHAIDAINGDNVKKLKEIFAPIDQSVISSYKNIDAVVEEIIYNHILTKSKYAAQSDDIISLLKELINRYPDKEKFKTLYSLYITNYCTEKIKTEEITNFHMLNQMKEAYLLCPLESEVCRVLVGAIKINLHDILAGKARHEEKTFQILDKIILYRTDQLKYFCRDLEITISIDKSGEDSELSFLKEFIEEKPNMFQTAAFQKVSDYISKLKQGCQSIDYEHIGYPQFDDKNPF